jgi:hypothetical protein
MTEAKGIFEIADWKEDTYEQLPNGGKLTEARVKQRFTGDVTGEGSVIWLMAYPDPNTAQFVGIQRVVATIDGKRGSFLLETTGSFDGKTAQGEWSVIDGSGTDELAGISGEGMFEAPHGSKATYRLEYELERARVR